MRDAVTTVCNVRWLGLRSAHIEQHSDIGLCGEPLTGRDDAILNGLSRNNNLVRDDQRYSTEVQQMRKLGKYELQWLYGHADGVKYFSEKFLLDAILHGDYL